jgi:AcrR family transcriptional regulator
MATTANRDDEGRASCLLPVMGAARVERADAARNRAAILDAVSLLLRHQGVERITMDAVACAAGVGKGTLFRRFGDRANLFHALLDDRERRLQEGFIRGAPPLGPGAPAAERLVAFGDALIDFIEETGDLLLAAEAGPLGLRYRSAVYATHRAHVSALLRDCSDSAATSTGQKLEGLDAEYLADALLGVLRAELVIHQRRSLQLGVAELKRGWERLVLTLVG